MDVLSTEGPVSFDRLLRWLTGHSRSFYTPMSSEEAILGVPLCGLLVFLRPAISRWQFFAYLFRSRSHRLRRATTLKTQSMDLLVAGLRGIEPYGLYQYDSLVDRKGKTFDLLHPFMTSSICSSNLFRQSLCTKIT